MKLKGKLLTTYLIPILVVGILGLVAMLWSGHYFMAMIQNDNVKVQAALEIEINDTEAIKDIMNYLTYRTPDLLEQYKKNTSELKFFLAQYKNRGLDEKEVEYIAVFEKYLDEFEINANNLINIQQQQIIERKKIKELSKKITELFLSKIQEQLSRTNNIKSINKQKYISQINLNQHELTSIMRSYLLDNDQQDKENIKQKIEVAEKKIDMLSKIAMTKKEQDWLNILKKYSAELQRLVLKVISLEDQEYNNTRQLKKISDKMDILLDNKIQPIALKNLTEKQYEITILIYTISILMIVIILISGFVTWRNSLRMVINPIQKLKNYADELSKGNTESKIDIETKDELGELAYSFKKLQQNIHNLAKISKSLGEGNFDTEVIPRSEKDLLAYSLLEMKQSLQKLDVQNKEQIWLKTEVSDLTESIQGIRDVKKIIDIIFIKLAKIFNIGVGTFYLLQNESNNDTEVLKLFCSYAYTHRKSSPNKFKIGEGIIGQCAHEKTTIIMTDLPDNYIEITSGNGKAKPTCLVVRPILYEDKLIGVLEFGLFKTLSKKQEDMLEQICLNLGVIINGVMSYRETEKLLKKSQDLNNELNTQQEELREANEQLEAQKKMLQESEEELRSQGEELRVMNEELEEKTQNLEQQKSELESVQKDLEKRAEELALSTKYKSEFLANMSHELRTPLNSLLILSKKLAENKENNLTEKQVKSAEIIYNGGNDLLALINDILDLSKVESGKLQIEVMPCNINKICQNIKSQFNALMEEKNIKFEININKNLPEIFYSDEQRLTQILRNFISNAYKFTDQGSITLTVDHPNEQTKLAGITTNPSEIIAWSVKDSGIGIARDKQALIFEAFQQAEGSTSRKYGGTGLGLAISRAMADLMGGDIKLESAAGEGSTFTLLLPNISSPTLNEKSASTNITKNSTHTPILTPKTTNLETTSKTEIHSATELTINKNKTDNKRMSILIVEDDHDFQNILCEFAQSKGYQVSIASTGHEALAKVTTDKPNAILLDLGLPDMDGMEVLEILKNDSNTQHIPIHIISGHDEISNSKDKGAIGYLKKPVTQETLSEVFNKFENILKSKIKEILLVENNTDSPIEIDKLVNNETVTVKHVNSGHEAIEYLNKNKVDCIIMDLNLPDISSYELLEKISQSQISTPPTIIYTEHHPSTEEYNKLQEYTSSIVIKGTHSSSRLLDEVTLFLHTVESNFSKQHNTTIKMFHSGDEILNDKKILLVDDDMRNVFALSSELEEYNINVIIAPNGKQAIEKLQENTDVDLILMDIMMPIMDGYEAMTEIRKDARFKTLPIITLTAKAMIDDKNKCIQAGANDYISKPVNIEQLISMLKIWLSKK